MKKALSEWDSLKNDVLTCQRCSLFEKRNHVIFGEGNPDAEILIIGEGPGQQEDLEGRPFIGPSGQLLDKIFEACNFTREKHLFITNIVRCRPPENRKPTTEEAAECMPWLISQISMIRPEIIVLLGATALKFMAGPDYKISRDHGKWMEVLGIDAMPVYHPSALLRKPSLKSDAWKDFKEIVFKYRELVDPEHTSPHV